MLIHTSRSFSATGLFVCLLTGLVACLTGCSSPSAPGSGQHPQQDTVTWRSELDTIKAMMLTGRYAQIPPLARQVYAGTTGKEHAELQCGKALFALGTSYFVQSLPDSAAPYLIAAMRVSALAGDSDQVARSASNLALVRGHYLSDFEGALAADLRALRIFEALGDSGQMADAMGRIAGWYGYQGDLHQADSMYAGAVTFMARVDSTVLYRMWNNWGQLLLSYQPSRAVPVVRQSIALKQRFAPGKSLSIQYHNLAMAYLFTGHLDSAMQFMTRGVELARANGEEMSIVRGLCGEGEVLMAQGRYAQARAPLDSALALAYRVGSLEDQGYVEGQVAKQRAQVNDHAQALQHLKAAMQLGDSTMNEAKEASMNELRVRYETDKKDQENQRLRAAQDITALREERGRWYIGGAVLLALVVIELALVVLQRGRVRSRKREADLEQQAMRLQMDPHFLFNALNTIPGLYASGDPAHADDHVGHLSRFLRTVLETSRKRLVPLSQELTLVEHYLHICANRRPGSFTWRVRSAPAVHADRVGVPPMLVQPLVENALEHGLSGRASGGHVEVSVEQEGDDLRVEVRDNGVGRAVAAKRRAHRMGRSLGLGLVRDRIRMMGRGKQEPVVVRDEHHPDGSAAGTTVTLHLRRIDLRQHVARHGN